MKHYLLLNMYTLLYVHIDGTVDVVAVVSHIQRVGCQPQKTASHGDQSRSLVVC